jgi:hypothetical protein
VLPCLLVLASAPVQLAEAEVAVGPGTRTSAYDLAAAVGQRKKYGRVGTPASTPDL